MIDINKLKPSAPGTYLIMVHGHRAPPEKAEWDMDYGCFRQHGEEVDVRFWEYLDEGE